MITKEEAINLKVGDTVWYRYSATEKSWLSKPHWYKVNGEIKLWKRSPDRFYLPVRRGMRDCYYIDEYTNKYFYMTEQDALTRSENEAIRTRVDEQMSRVYDLMFGVCNYIEHHRPPTVAEVNETSRWPSYWGEYNMYDTKILIDGVAKYTIRTRITEKDRYSLSGHVYRSNMVYDRMLFYWNGLKHPFTYIEKMGQALVDHLDSPPTVESNHTDVVRASAGISQLTP